MNALGFISKENPVYLYRIVRSNNKNASSISFKEFVVVKAWSSSDNDILKEGHRYFDFYYNGRLYRKQEVALSEFQPFGDSKSFNIWSYERNDALAISECQKWINDLACKLKKDIRTRAMRLMADRDFASRLQVTEKMI